MNPEKQVYEREQIFCLWCGVGFYLLFAIAMWPLMQFVPPPSPMLTGEELVAKYSDNIFMIRNGIIAGIIGGGLLIPYSTMVSFQVARMERGRLPFMAVLSFGAAMVNALLFIFPFILWAGDFYRIDRDPELIRLLNDTTWLEFVMIVPPYAFMMFAIAYAGFTSTAKQTVLPRWYCFFNVWVALLTFPGMLALYFYEGPFAWNGILAFWLPVSVFILYFPISFWVFYKAIKSHKHDADILKI